MSDARDLPDHPRGPSRSRLWLWTLGGLAGLLVTGVAASVFDASGVALLGYPPSAFFFVSGSYRLAFGHAAANADGIGHSFARVTFAVLALVAVPVGLLLAVGALRKCVSAESASAPPESSPSGIE
ncbi:MAG: hypothetical protein R3B72_04620 [Polyangiaceae bacterium]